MTTAEHNTLIDQVTAGLPVTLYITRLRLILAAVLADGGPEAEAAFRQAIAALARRDRGEEWTPSASSSPPPRRP